MSLQLFCDQCVPAEIAEAMRRAGHTVIILREHLPIRSPDPVVLAKAGELGALLVSLNGDFSDIVTYPPAKFGGIIAIQLHNHPEVIPQVMTRLTAYFLPRIPGRTIIGENFCWSRRIASACGSEPLPFGIFLGHCR